MISLAGRLGIEVASLVEKTQKYAINQINQMKSISNQIIFVTNLCSHLKDYTPLIKILIERVSQSVSIMNFNDITAIIQLFGKLKVSDQSAIVQKLGKKYQLFL